MFQKSWEILVVDDELDVLKISKLAMRSFTVYGIPVMVHTATSKAEAIDLLETKQDLLPSLAAAFIDIVMETDTAGLELCQYIREERRNLLTQLIIRTGQPGVAPERDVIDRYEINAYFTKVEANEDKLYSMTKSAIRQFYWSSYAHGNFAFLKYSLLASGNRQMLAGTFQHMLSSAFQERSGEAVESFGDINTSWLVDNQVVGNVGWDEATMRAVLNDLDNMPGIDLNGDKVVIDDQNRFLLKVPARDGNPEVIEIATPTLRLPDYVVDISRDFAVSFAKLWAMSS